MSSETRLKDSEKRTCDPEASSAADSSFLCEQRIKEKEREREREREVKKTKLSVNSIEEKGKRISFLYGQKDRKRGEKK